jgi:hypothetical protein
MTDISHGNVAIVYPGDRSIRDNATPDNNRLAQVFRALAAVGLHAEPAVYHDDFFEEVRRQLMQQDAVLVRLFCPSQMETIDWLPVFTS